MTLKPEHIVEELNRTPKLKRDLIMKVMEVMLDSEAFLEAYPTLYDPRIADVDLEYREKVCEEMAQIIVRLFRKNKVRPDDAEKTLNRARECYQGIGDTTCPKTFDELDPDEVLEHYGHKPEDVRCDGVGIGVWRREEAFQKLGEIGAFVRFVDHKAKARIEFNYDPDFPAALLITHATTKKGEEKE